uniref:[Trp5]-bradykinin n=2 Tax=Holostei TaxID=1489100 RepID=BRK_AMICA|nr:RecName: Full=[Trp5]-bradykinin [Amia calva]P84774.1 RecName: Full=[Trp5]-bradykinin [Lepisosteus osseus]AAB35148.1 bradykinin [Amia calva=bowfin, plasma, Peptide, 9 aa] [Amia calva]AAB35149.1 bradykinin [Lepisosteus osseus=longnosed gar, plasma, Peptide, 9 aa] [Lepisosteus osseus]
RPPGWSPFR